MTKERPLDSRIDAPTVKIKYNKGVLCYLLAHDPRREASVDDPSQREPEAVLFLDRILERKAFAAHPLHADGPRNSMSIMEEWVDSYPCLTGQTVL